MTATCATPGYEPVISNREKAQNILARLKIVAPNDPRVETIASFSSDEDFDPYDTFISNLDFITREMEHAQASQPSEQCRCMDTIHPGDNDACPVHGTQATDQAERDADDTQADEIADARREARFGKGL